MTSPRTTRNRTAIAQARVSEAELAGDLAFAGGERRAC